MNNLILYCPENRPGKRDGDEFRREAQHLHDSVGGRIEPLVGKAWQRRRRFGQICKEEAGVGIGYVYYFGHGTAGGLVKFYRAWSLPHFAKHLARCCSNGLTVVTYACLSGKRFNGLLQDALQVVGIQGARVIGHSTAGHTTCNPNVTVDPPGGLLVDRDSPYRKAWIEALRTDWRFRFPQLSKDEIIRYLAGSWPPPPATIIPDRP